MSNKEQKGLYLLNELGSIDEDLLYEATDLYPIKRKRKKENRFILIACAAVACAFLLAPMTVIGSLFMTIDSLLDSDKGNQTENNQPPQNKLEELAPQEIGTELFFENTPLLICKEEGDDLYKVTKLRNDQFSKITRLMQQSESRDKDDAAPATQIWICDGKGIVKTPYLEDTPGNLSFATLFDYDPELVLSDELTLYLEELTS